MVRLALLIWLCGFAAEAGCRKALVLAVDVSSSVDAAEYRLQSDGLAAALLDPAVEAALVGPKGAQVALAIFEWSGRSQQSLVQDWVMLESPAQLQAIAGRLRKTRRSSGVHPTAIGTAMMYALGLFNRGPDCFSRTLDISGDGTNNDGPAPHQMRLHLGARDVTINGLIIPDGDIGELWAYYTRAVILGDGAFVEVATGFEGYKDAMVRKLLREVPLAFVKAD